MTDHDGGDVYPAARLDFLNYNPEPDYSHALPNLSQSIREGFWERLQFLYGEKAAEKWLPELERLIRVHQAHKTEEIVALEKEIDPSRRFSEKDVALITYGDLIKTKGHSSLAGLSSFLQERTQLRKVINLVHILPFFPYSSDRGFSVTDFRQVDPHLGSWMDIEEMTRHYRIMFDGVFNHISSRSQAFQEMLNGHPYYRDLAIIFRSPDALTPEQRKVIVRPRTSDILTRFDSINGPIWVWTTFSPDQIDLNFKNPAVLMHIIDTLLLYVRKGANLVRLDAVTYLWSEPGTPSANLEQTHEIIKLMRDILNVAAPNVTLVTETNVPHEENVAYFGNGYDEAQMVYNFSLPPLVLHAFYREDVTTLSDWVDGLVYPSDQTTFFNILDTHDGIGLMGAKGILSSEEIDDMIRTAQSHGALISYRAVGDGGQEPYEINSTWFGALNPLNASESLDLQVKRFVASRAISLAIRGVPGVYFHGLIGTPNDPAVVEKSGIKRDINRVMVEEEVLLNEAKDPGSRLMQIMIRLLPVLKARTSERAFHPNARQQVLRISPQVFGLLRTPVGEGKPVLAFTSVTRERVSLRLSREILGTDSPRWNDLVCGKTIEMEGEALPLVLDPYDIAWLSPAG